MTEHASTAIVQRLRSQHHDLRQGAYYSPSEDPTWDATAEAADEIEALRNTLRAIEALSCAIDAPWMCLAEGEDWDDLCGPCLAHGHLSGLFGNGRSADV